MKKEDVIYNCPTLIVEATKTWMTHINVQCPSNYKLIIYSSGQNKFNNTQVDVENQ